MSLPPELKAMSEAMDRFFKLGAGIDPEAKLQERQKDAAHQRKIDYEFWLKLETDLLSAIEKSVPFSDERLKLQVAKQVVMHNKKELEYR